MILDEIFTRILYACLIRMLPLIVIYVYFMARCLGSSVLILHIFFVSLLSFSSPFIAVCTQVLGYSRLLSAFREQDVVLVLKILVIVPGDPTLEHDVSHAT